MIDALIVKHCPTPAHRAAFLQTISTLDGRSGINPLVHDNDGRNIGLTRARNRLVRRASADVIAFMDFDLRDLQLDVPALYRQAMAPGVGAVVPVTVGWSDVDADQEWQPLVRCACNMLVLRREVADAFPLDTAFFVAFQDWDLLNRLQNEGLALWQHNASTLRHLGLSRHLPEKRQIWDRDGATYRAKWGDRTWR